MTRKLWWVREIEKSQGMWRAKAYECDMGKEIVNDLHHDCVGDLLWWEEVDGGFRLCGVIEYRR
jgi:hypothetical protein